LLPVWAHGSAGHFRVGPCRAISGDNYGYHTHDLVPHGGLVAASRRRQRFLMCHRADKTAVATPPVCGSGALRTKCATAVASNAATQRSKGRSSTTFVLAAVRVSPIRRSSRPSRFQDVAKKGFGCAEPVWLGSSFVVRVIVFVCSVRPRVHRLVSWLGSRNGSVTVPLLSMSTDGAGSGESHIRYTSTLATVLISEMMGGNLMSHIRYGFEPCPN
jgi:hypothetical protein